MKRIVLFLVFSLITVNVYSQSTCATAEAFCGSDPTIPSLIYPNSTGGTGGSIACLGSSPNPKWFYFKVDQSGTLIFDIIQNTAFNGAGFPTGTALDVDFAVWGPFTSATGNCGSLVNNCPPCGNNTTSPGNYPRPAPGNLVDCSYDSSPVEHLTIAGANAGQYYLAVVTNFSGQPGFIKLEQRSPILPTYGSTDCDLVCGISLGPDRTECSGTSINITASFASPFSTGTAPFQWLLGGVPQPAYDNMQTITVNQAGTWSVKTTRPGGCYQVTDSMVLTYYAPIPVTQPTDIVLCTSSPAPYIFPSINKDTQVLGALPSANNTVTYHTSQLAADNGFPTIPFANLTNYSISSSPVRIYVRIEDNTTGCVATRFFDLIVAAAPTGTISYPSSPYCTSITTPQPITSTATTGGTYTTNPTSGLTINSTTGAIIPSTSTPGTYTVNYDIPLSASCPAFHLDTQVVINPVLSPTINCGSSTTTSVTFTWTAVAGATGYNVSYQVNASPVVNVGAIGNVLTYSVTGLTPGDSVVITLTPTGPAGNCFLPNTQTCIANNCTPPTASISYSIPSTPSTSFCELDIVPKLVNLSGTGVFAPGTYTANPNTLVINATTGTITPNGSPVGVYTVTYTIPPASAGCSPVTATTSVTISPIPTIVLTSAASTSSQTLCANTLLTNIVYTIGGTATGASITAGALPAGVTGSFAAGVFTISGTPTVAGTFNYTVTTSGGCAPNASLSGTITVNPLSTMTLTSAPSTTSQTLCANTLLTSITYSVGTGVTGASITAGALPAGVTGSFAAGVFTISGTPTVAGTFNYTVTTSGGCAPNISLSGTITVTPIPTIVLTSAASTSSQTLCANTLLTNIVYTIGGTATGASITAGALPAGVTGSFAAGVFTISGTPTVAGTFNYTVTTSGGCVPNASLSGTITVNPLSTMTLTSVPSTTNQTLCANTLLSSITYSVGTGVTGASITAGALPTGVTGSFAAGVFTISGTPTVAGTFNYTVTTSGGCAPN
ncbi:MAG: beta strand repeat-containing protein, partial [Flavobacterium sp.]